MVLIYKNNNINMIKFMVFRVFFLTCLSYGETGVPMNYSQSVVEILVEPTDVDATAALYANETSAFDLVEESEYASNYWDCSTQDEELKQKNVVNIVQMLQKSEEKLEKTKRHVPDVVLVLGNAGVGKTTLVQFMAGDNSKLISKEVGKGTGEYLIEDGIKIGSSTTESKTLFPELVINESDGITYCDTPGFSDTRSPNHAVLATYVMRTYLKNFDRIKIVLMVTYHSVQLGMYKDDFMDLLRNLNNFIKKNFHNYKNNIVLIATKVPNNYIVTDNNVTLVSDESIISSIAEYIDEVSKSIEEKISNILDREEKEYLTNSLKILDCLKVKDENGKYKKINLFRRPSKAGPLNAISLLQNNKMSLRLTIQNGAEYTKLCDDDIGYTLSETAKNHLDCLLQYMNNKISIISKNIFEDYIKPIYRNKIDYSHDVYELATELKMTDVDLDKLKNDLDNSKNVTGYITTISTFVTDKNITYQNGSNFKNYEDEFKEVITYISKIEQFSNTTHILNPITWTAEIQPLKTMIKDSTFWYGITIKLYEYFSSYNVQKSVSKYVNDTKFNELNTSNNGNNDSYKNSIYKLILSNSDFLSDNDINSYFNQVALNNQKVKDLEEIISVTLNTPVNITCNNQGKLTVSGYFIKMSEINKRDMIKTYCGDHKLQTILINAIQNIFIDDDLDDDIFKGINLIVIAPRWEIIGARIIKLDGKEGNQQEEQAAGNQTDGLPGLPGENGGSFFGIGVNFNNGVSLKIISNGGNGGPGQIGKNGRKGLKGDDGSKWIQEATLGNDIPKCSVTSWQTGSKRYSTALSESLLNNNSFLRVKRNNFPPFFSPFHEPYTTTTPDSISNDMEYGSCGAKLSVFSCRGEEGAKGENGGHGAVGGYGGHAGNITLIELGQSSQIRFENKSGKSGTPGKGGKGGDGGENGSIMSCYKTTVYHIQGGEEVYWRCIEDTVSGNKLNMKGEDGLSNHSTIGLVMPVKPEKELNFSSDVLQYVLDLSKIRKNKFVSRIISEFRSKLMKQWFEINYKNLWRLIVTQDSLKP